jgi:hypothetical protein
VAINPLFSAYFPRVYAPVILEKNVPIAHAHTNAVPFLKLNISVEVCADNELSQSSLRVQKDCRITMRKIQKVERFHKNCISNTSFV